jgi:glycosyltransferase involved in cell wall biosynthesis
MEKNIKNDQRNTKQGNDKNYKKPYHKKPFYKKNVSKDLISAIVPVLNEEESLPEMGMLLERELKQIAGDKYEIIFIDDGSTDNSFEVIRQLKKRNNRIRAFQFRRNYGKSAALTLGFAQARGEIIVTLDADLQDDPSEIKPLLDKMKEGYDLVTGWKKKRYDPFTKVIPSRFFNWVTSKVSGIKLHDFNCGLKVYKREVTRSLQLYGEIYRYIPALANWEGFKVAELPVKHHPRKFGKSKFGSTRFIKGYLDLITVLFTTRYLKRPMHFFGTIGTIFASSGFIIDLYLMIEWFMGLTSLSNRPLALFGIALIIVGVQLFSIGLVGEMIVKNFYEKATYNIKERL